MSKQTKGDGITVKDKGVFVVEKSPVEMPKEYWAANSPYVDAYIRALNYANYDPIETECEISGVVAPRGAGSSRTVAAAPSKTGKKAKTAKIPKVFKKRKFCIALLAVVMLACIVVAGLGIIGPVGKYVAPYSRVGDDGKSAPISFIDPIYSLVKSFTAKKEVTPKAADAVAKTDKAPTSKVIELTTFYNDDMLGEIKGFEFKGATTEAIIHVIMLYAFPVLIVLFLLTCLYIMIKSIVALFSKKHKNRKRKFGFAWFMAFLLLIGTVIFGLVWNGLGMNEIKQFFTTPLENLGMKGMEKASTIGLGLGMYIELVLMLIGLILVGFSHKRIKPSAKNAAPKKTAKKA